MTKTNLLINASIFLAMLTVMEPHFTGIAIHEWLSLALAATVVVHLLLHWKWIVGVGAKFFRNLWHSSRLKFVMDALLFVAFVAVMLSGLLISRSVLPALGISLSGVERSFRMLHSMSADAAMLLVALHFALNWNWVVTAVKRFVIAPPARLIHPTPAAQPAPVKAPIDR